MVDKTLPTLTSGSAIAAADIFLTRQGSDTADKKVTGTQLMTFVNTSLDAGFGITISGGGSAITTGVKGYAIVPYAMTITGWDLVADQTGSIVIDVWKDTYANFPPTSADSIAGSEKPTLSSANKNQDTSLSTWTTSVSAGNIIAFNVDSASTVTQVTLIIKGKRA